MPDQKQRDEVHADATRVSRAHPSESGTEWSTWRPLRLPIFRNLLVADLVSDMGTFMQGVGAAWLMVSQGAGPLLVALTQTASAFPFFLLALPAGALGDIFDRRKLILTTEIWMFSVAVVLAILTGLHLITPWVLLLLTLALSIGDAMEAPTWRAVLPELVPQEGLMPAIALNGIEFNLARAIGPALGGFLIVAAGIGTVFWLNAASYVGVLWVIARWKRPQTQPGPLRETVSSAIRAAVRYTRNSPEILTVLGRIGCIMFFASAFWALLPTVAHELRRSATLYGLLLAVFGAGAVLGAMALQRTRSLFSSDALLALGTTVFAISLWGVAGFKSVALLSGAILFGGMAWTAVISLMTTVMQNLAPDWVRARAMAVFMLVYMGTWTAGSAFWGYIAGRHGTHFSLITAAIGTAVCPLLVLVSRLPDTPVDLGAWDHWGKPMLVGDIDPSQGPVLVTVEYDVDPSKAEEFLEALHKFARVRRRDGASRWGVYRDTEHPSHYVETFIVESWAEHLRQHERLTSADRDLEENVGRFESKTIKVRHFIYARSKRGRK
jgi:MFS family permease/quinol monooxygenase YgiN